MLYCCVPYCTSSLKCDREFPSDLSLRQKWYENVTRDFQNFINLGATVENVDAPQMIGEMRVDVQNVLSWKRLAVERIAEVAEHAAYAHLHDKNIKHDYYRSNAENSNNDDENKPVRYSNKSVKARRIQKSLKALDLRPHRNFANAPVNFNESSVHVLPNVFDRDPNVLNAITWSEYLTNAFRNNLQVDQSLNWQYFGSSTGFLRVFPATTWITDGKEKPEFYDCRTRPWYVQAAASAKDIVILVDGSGSMTGMRKEIAKNVVKDILSTLSEDDFVTVLRFSDVIEPVVECFENSLVQANEENIRMFLKHVSQMKTENIANFTVGLITAFELLQKDCGLGTEVFNEAGKSFHHISETTLGQCGIVHCSAEGIHHRWLDGTDQQQCLNKYTLAVKLESSLIKDLKSSMKAWEGLIPYTASASLESHNHYNRSGLGTQCNQAIMLITDGAPNTFQDIFRRYNYPNIPVRVFTYLIGKEVTEYHEVNWMACHNKGLYTHVASLAEVHDQVQKYIPVMSRPVVLSGMRPFIWTSVYADVPIQRGKYKKKQPLQLMTTVATPVYDKKSAKTANLLGVAGTDVPTKEIIKYTKPHKIGVNAYTFAITNNGYILYHPELRPLHYDILKPGYRNVDLTEVELVDENSVLYEYNATLLTIRTNMVDRRIGWKKMAVKIPMDNFKRVVTRNNSYYYGPIDDTPFSLAVSLPEPYGHYRVVGHVEVKMNSAEWMQYFSGNNWRVHPEWVYCENPQKYNNETLSPEENIKLFLSKALPAQDFRWKTSSTRPPIFDKTTCEKDLIQSLVFDAKATFVDPSKKQSSSEQDSEPEPKVIKMFGITTTFVVTRSGLTRYEDHRPASDKFNTSEKAIYDSHTKATEEVFYKRAVDFYHINSSAFVFSVPFDAGDRASTLVTGSHALFLGTGKKKAPAAVVGLQFNHSVFADKFFETTSKCMIKSCKHKCNDEGLDCYLLDNNGFIVVSENREYTGKFFGEIDYTLFDSMIEIGIYKRVHVYDYQAVCLEEDPSHGFSPLLLTPFHHIRDIFCWFWSKLALLYIHLSLYEWWSRDWIVSASDYDYDDDGSVNKTIPHPCEMELDLYEMLPRDFVEPVKGRLSMCHSSKCDKEFIVQPVPYTNLVMLVVFTNCPCETTSVSLKPREVIQNETQRCLRMKQNMYRRRPSVCLNYHPEETEMNYECGGCNNLSAVTISNLLVTFITSHILTRCFLFV